MRFPAMVAEWRARWGAEFPFFYVQLAPYGYTNMGWSPDQTQAARFREVQQQCMSDIPRSGMVATTDIGAVHTIHPPDKKTVAKRLLYLAYARCYGYKGFECSGPIYKSMEIQGENIALSFDHAPYGVSSYGEPLAGFEIAGEDRIFPPSQKLGLKAAPRSLYTAARSKRPSQYATAIKTMHTEIFIIITASSHPRSAQTTGTNKTHSICSQKPFSA